MPRNPRITIGVSFGHGDSSAALIVDGKLVAAAEEERFTRVKHYALFPTQAIEYCLRHAKLSPKDVDVVAIARKPSNALGKRLALLWRYPGLGFSKPRSTDDGLQRENLTNMLRQCGLKGARVRRVEHHLAHMMSARILAGAPQAAGESLALFSFDGLGDFVSAASGHLGPKGIEILDRVHFPHSIGYFYTAMTQYLGFPHFGDEFKVMGLSSYGEPRYLPQMRELIRDREGFGYELNLEAFPILKEPMRFYIEEGKPKIDPFYHKNLITHMLGVPPRRPSDPLTRAHWDVAKSVQERFEELANRLLRDLHRRVATHSLALAGGCAHNSVWVGKIPRATPFTHIYVAPASHDAGIAVGAAALAANVGISVEGNHAALLGPDELELGTEPMPDLPLEITERKFGNEEAMMRWLANELAQKKFVGLMNGRMEFGPRALGSRSILADPRWADTRDRLNSRVKHREPFRPFAASVQQEHQSDWFTDVFSCPSMEGVFEVKASKRTKIPAVVHVDNSCRIQSVSRDTQPFFWGILEAFRQKTGIPMLVNTSFNDCEPIVCAEKDAWNCFSNSDLDHLILGTRVFSKARESLALVG